MKSINGNTQKKCYSPDLPIFFATIGHFDPIKLVFWVAYPWPIRGLQATDRPPVFDDSLVKNAKNAIYSGSEKHRNDKNYETFEKNDGLLALTPDRPKWPIGFFFGLEHFCETFVQNPLAYLWPRPPIGQNGLWPMFDP